MYAKIYGWKYGENRIFAQSQSFFPQVNLHWRNLADTINQVIKVNLASNET